MDNEFVARMIPPNLFIARAIFRRRVAEALALPCSSSTSRQGRGAAPASKGGGERGAGMGGRWAERPPARSPAAAGVVAGAGGVLGFWVAGGWGGLHSCWT